MRQLPSGRNSNMDKETKSKMMIVFAIAAFLMLLTFQGKAEEVSTMEPASIEETTAATTPVSTDSSEEIIEEEDSSSVYYPSAEDSTGEVNSFDE